MKKYNMKYFIIVIIMIIIVYIIVRNPINNFIHKIEIENFRVLINYSDNTEDSYENLYNISRRGSKIIEIGCEDKTSYEDKFFSEYGNVILALQLKDGSMGVVSQNNETISLIHISKSNIIENQVVIDRIPEQILEFDNKIVLKSESVLYCWDYYSNNEIQLMDIPDKYYKGKLFSCDDNIISSNDNYIYLYNAGMETVLENNSLCLGFADENTIVFAYNKLSYGLVVLYKYDIIKSKYYGFKLLSIPGYIFEAAYDPTGTYMLYFSSDGEGGLDANIIDLKYYTKKKIDFKTDCISNIQWLK